MASLVLENVIKRYGKVTALNNVSFEVKDGEFIVLLGPSGAGKTTTLKVVAGVEPVASGYIYIGGKLVNPLEPHERGVAMAYESYALYPHFTVYENLAFPLRNPKLHLAETEIDKRVKYVAELLNIHMLLDRKPVELSNGQKQRASLGRCLVRESQISLLDEPLSHLDAKLRHRMRTEFKRLQATMNTTTIYVTHDYLEALSLADRIIALDKGVIQQIGTPDELYNQPCNEFVAKLLGEPEINIIDGFIKAQDDQTFFISKDGSFRLLLNREIKQVVQKGNFNEISLGLRPLYMSLIQPKTAEFQSQVFDARVYVFEPLGTKGILTATIGKQRFNILTDVDMNLKPDQDIKISINSDKVMFFDSNTGGNILIA
jgi:multiple sugar transport system ATP-binding protein